MPRKLTKPSSYYNSKMWNSITYRSRCKWENLYNIAKEQEKESKKSKNKKRK